MSTAAGGEQQETVAAFARRVLLSVSLDEKLTEPGPLIAGPGEGAFDVSLPGRPPDLRFAGRREAPVMPKPGSFADPNRRAVAHHIMANHELQALEVMAATILRFPDAPPDFRTGIAEIMRDEQRHTRMHAARAAKLGQPFGSLPVNGYIWEKAREFACELDYVAGLPLVFEGANLDHTIEFAEAFERAGDDRSAAVMRRIHDDEVGHVAFGMTWLRKLKPPGSDDWETFLRHLHFPLRPVRARGDRLQVDARRKAGMGEEFIAALAATDPRAARREAARPRRASTAAASREGGSHG